MNAVNGLAAGSSSICQKPAVRSKVVKTLEWAKPTSLMHSSTDLMLYLSGSDFSLRRR